jgi:hypothetical protein|nr:MAG TPA: tail completion protein [Caudoviricetes sp.]
MVKLSEILKAVNDKLAKTFPKVEIDSKDITEKFNRPSFRTELEGLKTSAFMTTYKERNLTIRIYYFPKNIGKSRIERLKMMDDLEEAFLGTLWINESFAIPTEEIEFEETDGVLIASIDSYTMEEIENDITEDMMEELEFNYKG